MQRLYKWDYKFLEK